MPVTSSASSVKRWPSAEHVLRAARGWASDIAADDAAIVAVGVFGSYARGDAGFGSDLDLIVIRRDGAGPFDRRAAASEALPVPADVLIYTAREWRALVTGDSRMARVLQHEARWLHGAPP
jgi:uncharacterized protein